MRGSRLRLSIQHPMAPYAAVGVSDGFLGRAAGATVPNRPVGAISTRRGDSSHDSSTASRTINAQVRRQSGPPRSSSYKSENMNTSAR